VVLPELLRHWDQDEPPFPAHCGSDYHVPQFYTYSGDEYAQAVTYLYHDSAVLASAKCVSVLGSASLRGKCGPRRGECGEEWWSGPLWSPAVPPHGCRPKHL
jgi:hypothetical protein